MSLVNCVKSMNQNVKTLLRHQSAHGNDLFLSVSRYSWFYAPKGYRIGNDKRPGAHASAKLGFTGLSLHHQPVSKWIGHLPQEPPRSAKRTQLRVITLT